MEEFVYEHSFNSKTISTLGLYEKETSLAFKATNLAIRFIWSHIKAAIWFIIDWLTNIYR